MRSVPELSRYSSSVAPPTVAQLAMITITDKSPRRNLMFFMKIFLFPTNVKFAANILLKPVAGQDFSNINIGQC